MAIAALIAAYHEAEATATGLRALLPMAGRTLLEYQVRRAVGAGARHCVILVERVPAALNEALDRLRRDGIAVEIARTPSDAADRFHPEETIILIADGLIAAPPCFDALAAQRPPAVLVVPDIAENEVFERVDAQWRWAGLALTDAATLADTAAMLGDWDLQSTLMRRIVQSNPRKISPVGEGETADPRATIVIAETEDASRLAGKTDFVGGPPIGTSWIERSVLGPIAALLAPLLIDRPIEPNWLRIAASALAAGGAAAFFFGWLWSGVALLMLPGMLCSLAARIDIARLRDPRANPISTVILPVFYVAAIGTLAHFLAETSGNLLYYPLAGLAVLGLLLVARLELVPRANASATRVASTVRATATGALWLLPLFGLASLWAWWPGFVAVYALVSALYLVETARRNSISNERVNNGD